MRNLAAGLMVLVLASVITSDAASARRQPFFGSPVFSHQPSFHQPSFIYQPSFIHQPSFFHQPSYWETQSFRLLLRADSCSLLPELSPGLLSALLPVLRLWEWLRSGHIDPASTRGRWAVRAPCAAGLVLLQSADGVPPLRQVLQRRLV